MSAFILSLNEYFLDLHLLLVLVGEVNKEPVKGGSKHSHKSQVQPIIESGSGITPLTY